MPPIVLRPSVAPSKFHASVAAMAGYPALRLRRLAFSLSALAAQTSTRADL